VTADRIEGYVIGQVVAVAESSDALAMIEAESNVRADELRLLVTQRGEAQSKLDRLEDKWADDTISAEAYHRNRKAFQAAIRAAEDRIAVIEGSSVFGRVGKSLVVAWESLGYNEQHKVIKSMLSSVTVFPATKKGGNTFDPRRARIEWRSSALALAAGMDEWPFSEDPLPRDQSHVCDEECNRLYAPEAAKTAMAISVAQNNVASAGTVPAFVRDALATIHP
jgi:hypothetical protein